jgi:dTDP-glucose 4,6-dehydratase
VSSLLRLIGKSEDLIRYVLDRPGHDRRYALNCKKMEFELGWKARTSLEDGLLGTIEWYKRNGNWLENVRAGEYLSYYEKYYERRGSSLQAIAAADSRRSR